MSLISATEAIKQILPWVTVAGIVWRIWYKTKGSITDWADTLLDNHMAHLQGSLDRMERQQDAQIDLLSKIANKK